MFFQWAVKSQLAERHSKNAIFRIAVKSRNNLLTATTGKDFNDDDPVVDLF